MTKDTTNKLPGLVNQIRAKLDEAFDSLKRTLDFYREAGRLLRKAKSELKAYSAKPWRAWLISSEGPGIQHRVAEFYMRLDRKWKDIIAHPDFNPQMGYMAALKLVSKPKRINHVLPMPLREMAHNGSHSASITDRTPVPLPLPAPDASPDEETAIITQGTPTPLSIADAADSTVHANLPQQALLPPPPCEPVANVKARISGDADLEVSPTDGYGLLQVLDLLKSGEATAQVDNDVIVLADATIIADYKVIRHNYSLNNFAVTTQAA